MQSLSHFLLMNRKGEEEQVQQHQRVRPDGHVEDAEEEDCRRRDAKTNQRTETSARRNGGTITGPRSCQAKTGKGTNTDFEQFINYLAGEILGQSYKTI